MRGACCSTSNHPGRRRALAAEYVPRRPHLWNGIQLDETAFVILLVDLARREKALEDETGRLWPMVRRAAGYLVRHGPVTPMDRWEEETGYFASTMAVEIAALLAAADLAEDRRGSRRRPRTCARPPTPGTTPSKA